MKKLLTVILCVPLITIWATPSQTESTLAAQPRNSQQAQQQAQQKQERARNYNRYMRLGYAANKQKDYQAALENFRQALQNRPNDPYARKAIVNAQASIQRLRALELKRQALERRVQILGQIQQQAITAQDWRCAAEATDQLIPLFPANSLKRAELVAYRGQLQGYLNAGTNLNGWSTVCSRAGISSTSK
jgi:tetratricopeptide (TPR) repeat protein